MNKHIDLLKGNITISLAKLAFPLMGMSFLQMAYNLTDMFWIGRLGPGSVAAIGTGGLILWLCSGVHMLAQLGGQVLVAQNLGAKNIDAAAKYAKSAMQLSIIISLLLGFVFLFFTETVVSFFNLNEPQVIQDSIIYIRITGGFILFQLLAKLLTSMITTTGNSKTPFFATAVGLVFNMILDPVLIFGIGPIPAMGVMGAALATLMAQIIVASILLLYARKDSLLFSHVNIFSKPDFSFMKTIIKLSFPVTLQATLFPLISMYISRLVADFGDSAVAVQRVGSQIESISWMTSEGFAIAVNSFIAQNYGARNLDRAKKGFFQAFYILITWGLFATLLLSLLSAEIFGLFLPEKAVLAMGVDYLIIISISQVFMCIEILCSNAMNAYGKTKAPAIVIGTFTAARIPMALFLSSTTLGLSGIWWSVSISSIIKGSLLLFIFIIFIRKNTLKKGA